MKIISKFGGNKAKTITIRVVIAIALVFIVNLLYSIFFSTFNLPSENNDIEYAKISTSPSDTSNQQNVENPGSKTSMLPLEIFAKGNFHDYQKRFSLPKDTTLSINAVGEAADYSTNPFLFNAWDNDGIELYFDMNNNKAPLFDINGDDRQYRILWKTLLIDGKNFVKTGVKVTERDPSPTLYIMEITFPWKSLGYVIPQTNVKVGFDAAILDSDGASMKGKLDWHSKNNEGWRNTSYYGTMILDDGHKAVTDSNYCIVERRHAKVSNDKQASLFSSRTPFYELKNITIGYVKDSLDLYGKFKAEWDDQNLYLQVYVRDNVKTLARALFDYGWIENEKGEVVWQMQGDDLKYAGGALKNKRIDTTVFLKKGTYYLKYHTDESHSPGQWDDAPPKTPFYGIKVDFNDKNKMH